LNPTPTDLDVPFTLATKNKLKQRKLDKFTAIAGGLKEGIIMSKQEIAKWTQRVEEERADQGATDEGQSEGGMLDWTKVSEDWDEFMLFAKSKVMASSTKARIGFISGRLVPLALKAG
jgi:hypothetical protein